MNGLKEQFYSMIFSQYDVLVIDNRKCNICGKKITIKKNNNIGMVRRNRFIFDHFADNHIKFIQKIFNIDTPSRTSPVVFVQNMGCSICYDNKIGRVEHSCERHPYIVNILNLVENLKKKH